MPIFNTYPEIGGASDTDLTLVWDSASGTVKTVKGSPVRAVSTIAALKALVVTSIPDGFQVHVQSFATSGDGGGGIFAYDSTSAETDNGGTVIAPTSGSGKWLRVYSGPLNVKWFGAKGDGATNDKTAFQAAIDATPTDGSLLVPKTSTYYKIGTAVGVQITITKGISIYGETRSTKLKLGTEAPASSVTMFSLTSGTSVYVSNITLEGPQANNNLLCRGFSWTTTGTSGLLSLRNVTSTKFQEVVKLEGSAALDGTTVDIEDCDLENNNDGADTYQIIQVGTVGLTYGGRINISRTRLRSNANSYCIYRAWQTSLSLQDCDIGPGDDGATSPWLIYAEGGPATAPTYNVISNCRFNCANVTDAAILTNKYGVEQISNCSFKSGRGIQYRGSTEISNCVFDASSIENRNDTLTGSSVLIENCTFKNCFISSGTLADLVSLNFSNCYFVYTTGANTEHITINSAGTSVFIDECEFHGGPTYQVRFDYAAKVEMSNCRFYTGVGVSTASIRLVNTAQLLDFTTREIWFEDSSKGYSVSGADFGVGRRLMLRKAPKPGTVASADAITLDWNYDTYRITGVTTINKLSVQDAAYTSHPTYDVSGSLFLIVEGAFAMGTGTTNIYCDAAARTVNRIVELRYNAEVGHWIEVT